MNLEYFLQLLVQGIIIGCVYATAALGFVLIYKSSRVINLAHGYLIAIGGFLTYTFYGLFRGLFGASSPSMLSFIPAALCGLAASYLLDRTDLSAPDGRSTNHQRHHGHDWPR
jgi:branched-subunit amino acid ABC-type transport system permease component